MSNDNNLAQTLGKIPLFQGMHANELKVVLGICKAVNFADTDIIFNEGDPSHNLYILLAGEVEICTRKNGSLNRLNSCDIFGEIGLITQRTRSASAIAHGNCKLLRIDHVEFNLLAGKHPRISAILHRNISTNLASHVLRMNNNTALEHIPAIQTETPDATRGPQVIGSI
jgi:CRP-like cAMP-binding protein